MLSRFAVAASPVMGQRKPVCLLTPLPRCVASFSNLVEDNLRRSGLIQGSVGGLLWFNMSEEASLLVSAETYEENAVNIRTQQKSADMSRFIDRVREDGLYLP